MTSSIINWYFRNDFLLAPAQPRSKAIVENPDLWYSTAQIDDWMKGGGNAHVMLAPNQMIIDIDVRPDRDGRPEAEQLFAHNLDMLMGYHVTTGNNGYHLYVTLPDRFLGARVRPEFRTSYPGLDILLHPRFALIPGSVHPDTGKTYKQGPRIQGVSELPPGIADLVLYHPPIVEQGDTPKISNEELKGILSQLPIEAYAANDLWQPLMFASHHATDGAGRDVFLDWSVSDPKYSHQSSLIAARWDSIKRNEMGSAVTGRTLYQELKTHGGQIPKSVMDRERETSISMLAAVPVPALNLEPALELDLTSLSPDTTPEQLRPFLISLLEADPLAEDYHTKQISNQTQFTRTAIRKALKSIRDERGRPPGAGGLTYADLSRGIATRALAEHWRGGDQLRCTADGQYFVYERTHWRALPAGIVSKLLLRTIDSWRADNPADKFGDASVLGQAEVLLRALIATDHGTFGSKVPPSVVNTLSCEVWIDPEQGTVAQRRHDPKSELMSCVPVEYDPTAVCPRMDRLLHDCFCDLGDGADVERHIWEMIGYAIQPNKDIAIWSLWYGMGENGKSQVLTVLQGLMGNAALNQSIGYFDTSRNRFALSQLLGRLAIIDDDLKKNTQLPDDFLKKATENKALSVETKYGKAPLDFVVTSMVIMAGNHYPYTSDLSRGLRRRATVIPFIREVPKVDRIPKLGDLIVKTELAGVLNKALAGLERLRKRGSFEIPNSCAKACDLWLQSANQLVQYLDERYDDGTLGKVKFTDMWVDYSTMWVHEAGVRRVYTRNNFGQALRDLGYKVSKATGNVLTVFGLTKKSEGSK